MRSILNFILCIGLVLNAGLVSSQAGAEPIKVIYIEYPPYYQTNPGGEPGGIIVDRVRRLFDRAGISYVFSLVPSKRVMLEMQSGAATVSIGWFKTAEREKFAKFSLPIYMNKPVGVFMLRDNEHRIAPFDSFATLMDTRLFKIGRIDGHSEGEYMDSILMKYPQQIVWLPGDEVQLIKMLAAKRFDFILLPPEEVEVLVKSAGYEMENFILKTMSDIPDGNARYIMYSKSIEDTLVEHIDRMIEELDMF